LAAMMRLVIEEMQQERCKILLDLGGIAGRAIADDPSEIVVAKAVDIGDDARILGLTLRTQLDEIIIKNGVEIAKNCTLASEALQPDAVAEEKMVQRPMQRAEEGAAIGTVIAFGQRPRRVIEPPIDPFIIGREHLELGFHRTCPALASSERVNYPDRRSPAIDDQRLTSCYARVAVIAESDRFARPEVSKFVGSSHALIASRIAGHSLSRIEYHAVSRLRPLNTR